MKIYSITIELGVDDKISIENIDSRIKEIIQEEVPEMKMFRISSIKESNVISGEYRLSVEETSRLHIDNIPSISLIQIEGNPKSIPPPGMKLTKSISIPPPPNMPKKKMRPPIKRTDSEPPKAK
jgi:hypothetical protein